MQLNIFLLLRDDGESCRTITISTEDKSAVPQNSFAAAVPMDSGSINDEILIAAFAQQLTLLTP